MKREISVKLMDRSPKHKPGIKKRTSYRKGDFYRRSYAIRFPFALKSLIVAYEARGDREKREAPGYLREILDATGEGEKP